MHIVQVTWYRTCAMTICTRTGALELNISKTVRDRGLVTQDHDRPSMENGIWGMEWTRDQWRHVTMKCQCLTKLCLRTIISKSPRDTDSVTPKAPVLCKPSLRMREIMWHVAYLLYNTCLHLLIYQPTLPFHFDTFIGLRWRIRGVYSWDPCNKCEIEWKFCPDLNWPFLRFQTFWVWGFKKVAKFSAKGTPLRKLTSSEPLCIKIDWGVWPTGRFGEKVIETPVGNTCRR